MSRIPQLAAILVWPLILAAGPLDGPRGWEVEGLRIAAPELVVRRESTTTPPQKPGAPTRADDVFKILTDLGPFEVKYSRHLNRPPTFTGRHPACPTGDWGLGISGLGSHWYRGNTVRVLIDGQDIVARHAADSIETRTGGGVARLRFLWKLPVAEVAICVAAVNRRSEGFVEIVIQPRRPLKSVGVALTCYPGGFGPYYGIPSRRVVRTEGGEVSAAAGQANRTLRVPAACSWVWYADHEDQDRGLCSHGSVALVRLPEERAEGEVRVSSYGVFTRLEYPGTQSRIRLALSAGDRPNPRAWEEFVRKRPGVVAILKTLDFWPAQE